MKTFALLLALVVGGVALDAATDQDDVARRRVVRCVEDGEPTTCIRDDGIRTASLVPLTLLAGATDQVIAAPSVVFDTQAGAATIAMPTGADADALSDALAGGHWALAAAILIWLLVRGVSRNARGWFGSRHGKTLLALLLAGVYGLVQALAGGLELLPALMHAVLAALGATGGHSVVKNLRQPNKLPAAAGQG